MVLVRFIQPPAAWWPNILNRIKTPQAQKERGWLCLESSGRVAGAEVVAGKHSAGRMQLRSAGPHSPGSVREFLALIYETFCFVRIFPLSLSLKNKKIIIKKK